MRRIAGQFDAEGLPHSLDYVKEHSLGHRSLNDSPHLEEERPVICSERVVSENDVRSAFRLQRTADMRFSEGTVRRNQAISANQPIEQRLHRPRTVTDFRVREHCLDRWGKELREWVGCGTRGTPQSCA